MSKTMLEVGWSFILWPKIYPEGWSSRPNSFIVVALHVCTYMLSGEPNRKHILLLFLFAALSILLSCLLYAHSIGMLGILGIVKVFIALSSKIYAGQRCKAAKNHSETQNNSK